MKKTNVFTRDELMESTGLMGPPEKVLASTPQGATQSLSKEIKKEATKKRVQDTAKLETLVQKSGRTLLRASTVFPFHLFPKTIVIEEHKVDVILPIFFFSRQIESILLEYITSVQVTTSIFFASLRFEVWGMDTNPPVIDFLRKKDALAARRIIQGLLACKKEGITIDTLDTALLRKKLEEIGTAGG